MNPEKSAPAGSGGMDVVSGAVRWIKNFPQNSAAPAGAENLWAIDRGCYPRLMSGSPPD
jgi:hypothetical protein